MYSPAFRNLDFCQVVAEAKDIWLDVAGTGIGFPLYDLEKPTGDWKCQYAVKVKNKYDDATIKKETALACLTEAKMIADMATAKKKAISKSLEAAKAAHKC